MNRRAPRSPRAPGKERPPRAGRERSPLAATLQAHAPILKASAIPAGLGLLRPRSSPGRLAFESERFIAFLSGAIASGATIERRAQAEVRDGCLAAASIEELTAVFALWRRVLRAYLPTIGRGSADAECEGALDTMESASLAAQRAWAAVRVDLVVIGASAGGLEPVSQILEALDATTPVTLAVVQHVGEADRGLLPQVLGRRSRLTIAAAVDGAKLYLGHAYIAPPGRHLVVGLTSLRLVEGPPVHFVKPAVDVLFESAAGALGHRVTSVILSGTGRDGAAGTCAIHDHGGLTFCQDPDDAEFRGMPEAAMATGRVDRKLSIGALTSVLASTIRKGRDRARHVVEEA